MHVVRVSYKSCVRDIYKAMATVKWPCRWTPRSLLLGSGFSINNHLFGKKQASSDRTYDGRVKKKLLALASFQSIRKHFRLHTQKLVQEQFRMHCVLVSEQFSEHEHV